MPHSPPVLGERRLLPEQLAVLQVLLDAAGRPVSPGEIASRARALLPEALRWRVGGPQDVVCILRALRLRPQVRRALRAHNLPQPEEGAARRCPGQPAPTGRAQGGPPRGNPAWHAGRPWQLGMPGLAAVALAGCAAGPQPLAPPVGIPSYFPSGVVAKADVPRVFKPFDPAVVACLGHSGCADSAQDLEAVALDVKTPAVTGGAPYHAARAAVGAVATVAHTEPPGLPQPGQRPSALALAAAAPSMLATTGAPRPAAEPAAVAQVSPVLAAGVPAWRGSPPTAGAGLRLAQLAELPTLTFQRPAPVQAQVVASHALPVARDPGAALAEVLGRLDPTLPELHARAGPTRQAAAVRQAFPDAERPVELMEIAPGHYVVAFDKGSRRVHPQMRAALRHVASNLAPGEQLELRGRVGYRQPDVAARALAAGRADAVRAELVALGVRREAITVSAPRGGDLLAPSFDSPLNRSVSVLKPAGATVAAARSTRG